MNPNARDYYRSVCDREEQSKVRYQKLFRQCDQVEAQLRLIETKAKYMIVARDQTFKRLQKRYPEAKFQLQELSKRTSEHRMWIEHPELYRKARMFNKPNLPIASTYQMISHSEETSGSSQNLQREMTELRSAMISMKESMNLQQSQNLQQNTIGSLPSYSYIATHSNPPEMNYAETEGHPTGPGTSHSPMMSNMVRQNAPVDVQQNFPQLVTAVESHTEYTQQHHSRRTEPSVPSQHIQSVPTQQRTREREVEMIERDSRPHIQQQPAENRVAVNQIVATEIPAAAQYKEKETEKIIHVPVVPIPEPKQEPPVSSVPEPEPKPEPVKRKPKFNFGKAKTSSTESDEPNEIILPPAKSQPDSVSESSSDTDTLPGFNMPKIESHPRVTDIPKEKEIPKQVQVEKPRTVDMFTVKKPETVVSHPEISNKPTVLPQQGGYSSLLGIAKQISTELNSSSDDEVAVDLNASRKSQSQTSNTLKSSAGLREEVKPMQSQPKPQPKIITSAPKTIQSSQVSGIHGKPQASTTQAKPAAVPVATKPEAKPAGGDDFLAKLFPDKFVNEPSGQKTVISKSVSKSIGMFDDSDDDITVPTGKNNQDDSDFFD